MSIQPVPQQIYLCSFSGTIQALERDKMSLTHKLLSFVGTVDIIVPVKLGLGQHILRPPLLVCIAILAPILFECLTDVLKGQLADTEADRNPDGRLCVVADL